MFIECVAVLQSGSRDGIPSVAFFLNRHDFSTFRVFSSRSAWTDFASSLSSLARSYPRLFGETKGEVKDREARSKGLIVRNALRRGLAGDTTRVRNKKLPGCEY